MWSLRRSQHAQAPAGGGGVDIVAVCAQEAKYDAKKALRVRAMGRVTGSVVSVSEQPAGARMHAAPPTAPHKTRP